MSGVTSVPSGRKTRAFISEGNLTSKAPSPFLLRQPKNQQLADYPTIDQLDAGSRNHLPYQLIVALFVFDHVQRTYVHM